MFCASSVPYQRVFVGGGGGIYHVATSSANELYLSPDSIIVSLSPIPLTRLRSLSFLAIFVSFFAYTYITLAYAWDHFLAVFTVYLIPSLAIFVSVIKICREFGPDESYKFSKEITESPSFLLCLIFS